MRKTVLSHFKPRRRVAATALALAVGLLAGACAGSSGSGSGGGSDSVTVGVSGDNVNILPVWVAQQKGYFTKYGVNVKLAVLSATSTNSALASGSVQFLAGSAKNFLTAVQQNVGEIAVAQTSIGVPLGLVVSTSFANAHHITKDTPLATVAKDLVGSTGGSASTSTTAEVNLFLKPYGVSTSSMKIATLSSAQTYLTALKTNEIDWFMTSEPTPLQAQAQGAGIVVATSKNVAAWAPDTIGPGNITITTKSYAAKNPDVVKKFTQAMQAAVQYIQDNEQSSAVTAIAANELSGVPNDVLEQSIAEIDWPETSDMTVAGWTAGVKFTVQTGAVSASTTVHEGTDWTNQYLG